MIKPIAFRFFIALQAICKPVAATAAPLVVEPRLQWVTDARFGMFVHFGIQTMAGSEWPGKCSKRDLQLQQESPQSIVPGDSKDTRHSPSILEPA